MQGVGQTEAGGGGDAAGREGAADDDAVGSDCDARGALVADGRWAFEGRGRPARRRGEGNPAPRHGLAGTVDGVGPDQADSEGGGNAGGQATSRGDGEGEPPRLEGADVRGADRAQAALIGAGGPGESISRYLTFLGPGNGVRRLRTAPTL